MKPGQFVKPGLFLVLTGAAAYGILFTVPDKYVYSVFLWKYGILQYNIDNSIEGMLCL